ncbi:PP2C family protein-serine/threonine phosphatase [Paracoccus siganidrum]|uniref:Serine/threonine-protein phosphatase n=1 Tax=Paracoccus siganidrum TaxID=1276757 RepID=A0A419AC97_9RHOB|nr:protein phosphatase 2C domain-containing protein [Paracoccus siganidrum]RJL21837.1 serine/threonine-protein phosphatase [Paracoccus siganidrum]RMC28835.1 serine/threonine-protein phosphatase [Paracoccus siganidrum]
MTGSDLTFTFRVGALTDKGRVRSHNEDSLTSMPEMGLWAVADGMGGHAAGDVASALIVEELASLGVPVSAQDQRARVLERLDRAHHRIISHAETNGLSAMGATIAILLIHRAELTCIWAGDSRVYLWRDKALTPLTRDHSEVAQMVAAGTMTEAEARVAPRRNVITRAIGIGPEARPETVSGAVRPGDRLLICSDGLTEHLDDADLAHELSLPAPPPDIAARLVAETLARGAHDNVSVIVIDCEALPEPEGEEL